MAAVRPGGVARRGVRAQLGVRLEADGTTLGSLNLYAVQTARLDDVVLAAAERFATHAAIALERTRYEHQLDEALASRELIGQAIGTSWSATASPSAVPSSS